jgi:hypothetical protein
MAPGKYPLTNKNKPKAILTDDPRKANTAQKRDNNRPRPWSIFCALDFPGIGASDLPSSWYSGEHDAAQALFWQTGMWN